MILQHKDSGLQVVMLDDTRLVNGWWSSDSKMVSYPASAWDEVKEPHA